MSHHLDSTCLDPSCFVSLGKLRDTIGILHEIHNRNLPVYLPTELYGAIMLPPEEKFDVLPTVINEWIDPNEVGNIIGLDRNGREQYVRMTRDLLSEFVLSPAEPHLGSIERIGEQSIYKKNVLEILGKVKGKIIFELLALSSQLNSKIIAFDRLTAEFVKKIGSKVVEMQSVYKAALKSKLGIKNALVLMAFVMAMDKVSEVTKDLQIPGIPLSIPDTIGLGLVGLLIVGNG